MDTERHGPGQGDACCHSLEASYASSATATAVMNANVNRQSLHGGALTTPICRSQIYHLSCRRCQKQNLHSAFWTRGTHRELDQTPCPKNHACHLVVHSGRPTEFGEQKNDLSIEDFL